MVRSLLCVMLCTSCLPVIQSHSWLACVDWDECSGTCHGYARNWHKRPSNPFGTDVGRDIRPGADVPLGLFCDPNKEGSSGPVEDRYSGTYPMAKVRPGQKLVWQWPAKNHADVGTQRGVQLFISKGPGLGDDFSHITSKTDWVQRYPELETTFSNCYVNGNKVGSGVDKAVCSGTFSVPSHLQSGIYTFMWWWEFNGGEFYNSCADVLITNDVRTPCVLPTTTTGVQTPSPTGPPANCGGVWTQCGGNGWGGATCCELGSTCQELNPYYFQCIPGASDPTPAPAPTTTTPAPSTTTTMTTPPETTTPTTTSTRECRPFCAQSSDSWSFKCSWFCCRGCSQCEATTTNNMTAPATTTTTFSTAATPLPGVCKPWCATTDKPWTKKCKREKCFGCVECLPPARRLAVTAQDSSDAIFV